MTRRFSEACERNKQPILNYLQELFNHDEHVLEIGSGSGQHAVHFSTAMPDLIWQTTELSENIQDLKLNLTDACVGNIRQPLELDVRQEPWPLDETDHVYSANTLHIMSIECVPHFFRGAGDVLKVNGYLAVYGPFRYQESYTSESNKQFDRMLKARDPKSGIRDFEKVNEFANQAGLELVHDYAMPANNQLIVWQKNNV